MDPSLKSQYQHLSQNLIAQKAYQNPQIALNMLGRFIFWDGKRDKMSQRIQTDIASSKSMFLNKTPSFTNGSTWFAVLYLMNFTCHLSFTISKFANKPHKDNDASPFKFLIWIPIKQTTVLTFQGSMALWSVPGKSLHILT
ncbi:hypothetical protein VP01_1186g5 [Puccinia sorghi]|uniref:Tet-like 2OG-Fe(II) oxygenase domain-containing protein n=2 Tax=Puccinia sorghi TaxID=27349 RepID=A0A0L6VR61_9BASI|nr:hypothetical protein VP01_1186g5 [Puccinia sorghi]